MLTSLPKARLLLFLAGAVGLGGTAMWFTSHKKPAPVQETFYGRNGWFVNTNEERGFRRRWGQGYYGGGGQGAGPGLGFADLIPLPLEAVADGKENSIWKNGTGFISAPRGTQSWNNIEFHLEVMLQLACKKEPGYRERILLPLFQAGVAGRLFSSLHLVAGTRFQTGPEQVAEVVWHYVDGTTKSSPIDQGTHIRSWVRPAKELPAHLPSNLSKVVWRSAAPMEDGKWLRLYRITIPNPAPGNRVEDVELISSNGEASLFVLAATLDTWRPLVRVGNSADLEPAS